MTNFINKFEIKPCKSGEFCRKIKIDKSVNDPALVKKDFRKML